MSATADTVNITEPMPPRPAVDQQLPVGVGEGGGAGRDRDDDQAGEVDRPLPEPGDQPAAGGGEEQPEERERADHDRAGRGPHAEALRELRQHRQDQPEPQRDDERRRDEHPQLARDADRRGGLGHGGGRHDPPVCRPPPTPSKPTVRCRTRPRCGSATRGPGGLGRWLIRNQSDAVGSPRSEEAAQDHRQEGVSVTTVAPQGDDHPHDEPDRCHEEQHPEHREGDAPHLLDRGAARCRGAGAARCRRASGSRRRLGRRRPAPSRRPRGASGHRRREGAGRPARPGGSRPRPRPSTPTLRRRRPPAAPVAVSTSALWPPRSTSSRREPSGDANTSEGDTCRAESASLHGIRADGGRASTTGGRRGLASTMSKADSLGRGGAAQPEQRCRRRASRPPALRRHRLPGSSATSAYRSSTAAPSGVLDRARAWSPGSTRCGSRCGHLRHALGRATQWATEPSARSSDAPCR